MNRHFYYLIIIAISSCTFGTEAEEVVVEQDEPEIEQVSLPELAVADSSDITCPKCGYSTVEELPTDVCLLSYDCKECGETMHPADGDCCVFCTHGSEKCPSMQE